MSIKLKLLDFNIYNEERENDSDDSDCSDSNVGKYVKKQDTKIFVIQMFGLNEKGETFSIFVENYQPFFFMKVNNDWTQRTKSKFVSHIKGKIGNYYEDSIVECKLTKKHKLYGFDNHKSYKFVMMKFKNTTAMNKVKNLFYYKDIVMTDDNKEENVRKLKPDGYKFNNTNIKLYEANIPPLLRYFHMRNISPSGWISISKEHLQHHYSNMTTCTYEYTVNEKEIISLPNEETNVPYKICSFDIEASSSHGDFPLPTKNYKKLTANILDYWDKNIDELKQCSQDEWEFRLRTMILIAFNFINDVDGVDIARVYPKKQPKNKKDVLDMIDRIIKMPINKFQTKTNTLSITSMFNDSYNCENSDEEYDTKIASSKYKKKQQIKSIRQTSTIFDILNDIKCDREERLNDITNIFDNVLPQLEGDKVTFIGSTFIRNGEQEPYLNHCIALDTCDDVNNSIIESYKTEKEVLLAWTKLIQTENPDIIIGYNIFGFDYKFMFYRAKELRCLEKFLQLSRNVEDICCKNIYTEKIEMDEKNIKIASGDHKLSFIKMPGRVQIDMYNYFRREYNLTSYKLDYVSGHFIGDKVKKIEHNEMELLDNSHTNTCIGFGNNDSRITKIYSKNLAGLKDGNFIHFEEIGHSTEYYKDGAKFEVCNVNEKLGTFIVCDIVEPDMTKIVKWCLAKDDVSPQDIFRLTNQGPSERSIVAKYCIQDCNLVHHILNKIDVITGFVEMAKLCSVPFEFLIMRGQGIKLFSFIAKKCREANTLIPVVERKNDGGYEGAIVLDPKCGLYLDEPVACVDYSSLYPSSMISENISHDSKVWTREYDLDNNLIGETGVKDVDGEFIYDNLPDYDYVDIEYDTYKYIRKTLKGAEIKTKVGRKICRFAQFPDNNLAIMPRILKDLLAARKATRASAKYKTIKTSINDYIGMIIEKDDKTTTLKDKDGNIKVIENRSIQKIENTYNDFMKNVLDKRQIAIKLTANSLYGQCGARTSSFYEKDVAASTTATGRKLLTYGKRVIEEVYGNKICETKYGKIHSHAEYIYGDTDSVFMSFKLTDLDGNKIVGKEALKHTIELAKEAGALATQFLKAPHDLEYEKTFMPFCLLSKKRYVGMLYEEDPDKCYRKSMGIVLKRRDNAPIVKDIYGGIIDILMKEQDVNKAIAFTKQCLQDMVDEKYPLEKLIITKSLRAFYKNPVQIAHKVLADRMGKRDPGNKPRPGDRIPFVYIQTKGKKVLQGDRIESPNYIIKHKPKIRPDYSFYITNQIMKPIQQVFALVLQDIPNIVFRNKATFFRKLSILKNNVDSVTFIKKEQILRNKEVKELIFQEFLRKCNNLKTGQKSIKSFYFT